MSTTNDTTRLILEFLYEHSIFAWRQNVVGVPIRGGGLRAAGKSGLPDILGICPDLGFSGPGRFLGIEIKTGKDRLRPEQEGFHTTARKLGALILVVKDFNDFKLQWDELFK